MLPAVTPLAQSLAWMEANPLIGEVLIKDLLGFNAPRMAIAAIRSPGDFWDTTRMELSNTGVSLAGSFTLPFIFRWLAAKISGVSGKTIKSLGAGTLAKAKQTPKTKLAHLASSFGFLIPFAFAFTATPYFRNWLTLKQSGTANFEEIIGLGSGIGALDPESKKKRRTPKEEMAYQLGMMNKILAWGAGLGGAAVLGLGLAARRLPNTVNAVGQRAKKVIDSAFKNFNLNGTLANQINGDASIFVFWLLPAYTGYIMAARGKHERREQVIKTVNSLLWFTVFNRFITKPFYGKRFKALQERLGLVVENPPKPKAAFTAGKTGLSKLIGKAKYALELPNWVPSYKEVMAIRQTRPEDFKVFSRLKQSSALMQLGISIVMLAATPQILNVLLTRHKVNQEREKFSLNNGLRRLNKGLLPEAKLPQHLNNVSA